ncbi:hypothetical protein R2A130_0060 [Ahrensia sp. R2A130]|nr:hypothetical protein R2A130_0060 [Ahrensia sp. R2A130]
MDSDKFHELTWETGFTEEARSAMAQASGEQINFLGRNFNWDFDPTKFLKEVCRHPKCALSTAVYIFSLGQPSYFRDGKFSSSYQAQYEFLDWLVCRINNNEIHAFTNEFPASIEMAGTLQRVLKFYIQEKQSDLVGSIDEKGPNWIFNPDIVNEESLGINIAIQQEKKRMDEIRNTNGHPLNVNGNIRSILGDFFEEVEKMKSERKDK